MSTNYRLTSALVLLLVVCSYGVPPIAGKAKKSQLPRAYMPTGERMYKDYCASCHGVDGKGHGPVSDFLTKKPSDLTKLAKPRGGSFPQDYVATVLRLGIGLGPHGTSEMPVWGPVFQQLDNNNEAAVRQRIQSLCAYLESIQEK